MVKTDRMRVQAKVIDQGEIKIKPGLIEIITPPGVPPEVAVKRPEL